MLLLRSLREHEFAPIKNAEGQDSPETARKLYKDYLNKVEYRRKYKDSKNISIYLSQIFFGKCSDEHKAVVDAWYEVGVSPLNSNGYCKNAYHIMPCLKPTIKMETKNSETSSIYPNPTRDFVNIELQEDSLVEIIDINGKVVKALELSSGVNNVNVSDLPNGVYNIKTKDSVNKLLITK